MTAHRDVPKYIVVAPSYDENDGGSIVLHQLCHELNIQGEHARLWPMERLRPRKRSVSARFKTLVGRRKGGDWSDVHYRCNGALRTPLAGYNDVGPEDIVVYPEVIAGNPLRATTVVRWLLHRPGYHTNVVDYSPGDLFFKFDDFSENVSVTGGGARRLFLFTVNEHYRRRGLRDEDRQGSCYMLRKADAKQLVHDTSESVLLDGKSHKEIAEIFNRTKYFYCYDEATMYSQFAAICGCISIVIPVTFGSRSEWVEKHPLSKYGVAYGMDDIAHARETRHLVRRYLQELEQESRSTVRQFIQFTRQREREPVLDE